MSHDVCTCRYVHVYNICVVDMDDCRWFSHSLVILCCSSTGHRLGNRSDYSNRSEPDSSEYSNLFEPAFNSSSSGSTTSGAQLSSSTPDLPTSSTRSQFRNSTYTTDINTQSGNTVPSQESQPASSISPWANSISAQRFPQSSSLSLSSQASALAPSSTEERSQPPAATVDHDNDLSVGQTCGDRPKPTHTLTEGTYTCKCMYMYVHDNSTRIV